MGIIKHKFKTPQARLELATNRLTADRSTTELLRIVNIHINDKRCDLASDRAKFPKIYFCRGSILKSLLYLPAKSLDRVCNIHISFNPIRNSARRCRDFASSELAKNRLEVCFPDLCWHRARTTADSTSQPSF